jgi:hypothetical protein
LMAAVGQRTNPLRGKGASLEVVALSVALVRV